MNIKEYIAPFLVIISICYILTSDLEVKDDLGMRIYTIIIHLGILLIVYLILHKYGLSLITSIIFLGLFILLFGIKFYIHKLCVDKGGSNSLLLYLSLALGLYFYFNEGKKLADCSYRKFALALIFSTSIGAIVLTDAPIFILCLFILHNMLF